MINKTKKNNIQLYILFILFYFEIKKNNLWEFVLSEM